MMDRSKELSAVKGLWDKYLERDVTGFTKRAVGPEDADYNSARLVWNGIVDRRPALIIYCRRDSDVSLAVQFAREHNVPTAIRSGGHSHSGFGTCDDALVIDLSPMRMVSVDLSARTARVQTGSLLRDLDEATYRFGLAVPAGVVSHTGLAGLTLGGGFGYLSRRYGLTIDSLESIDAVTVSGAMISASQDRDPDLFWALRGAGANFAIATEFQFRLHPVGPVVAGYMAFRHTQMTEMVELCKALDRDNPRDLCIVLSPHIPASGPVALPIRRNTGDEFFYVRPIYMGLHGGADEVLRRLRLHGPVFDSVQEMTYLQLQSMMTGLAPHGSNWFASTRLIADISPELLDGLRTRCWGAPHVGCGVSMMTLGGAITDIPEGASAYPGRDAGFAVEVRTFWASDEDSRPMVEWAREIVAYVDTFDPVSAYTNILCDDYSHGGLARIYGREKWEKLRHLKAVYDPTNFLSMNHNIPPAS
jgi:FAD binding domain/Berberine and berberine like